MRVGQPAQTKKVESTVLTEDLIKARIQAHGVALQESNNKVNELRNTLATELDRNKQIIGAIKGIQGLLPRGEQVVDPNSGPSETGIPSAVSYTHLTLPTTPYV